MPTLTLPQIYTLTYDALVRCGASEMQATTTAESVMDAEAEGIRNVGLGYLPLYLGHLRHGKVNGNAQPAIIHQQGASILVDADHGFCHPAFKFALEPFADLANEMGIAVLTLTNSYSAGVVGWFNNLLAEKGLVSLAFANAPSSVAPYGGKKKLFGTNPIAFGAPRAEADPIIVDMATSATAKVNVKQAAREGREIPLGWAKDSDGNPTTDPKAGLAGSLSPMAGAKGYGIGLLVEILAAGMTGGNWAFDSSQFADNEDGPPSVGQLFIAIAPSKVGGDDYLTRVESLVERLEGQDGVRLPGAKRAANRVSAELHGVAVPADLIARIELG